MADIFAVVADATRRDVLRILHRRETATEYSSPDMSVSELVAELGLSQPTVSKHLRVLREADLVSVREQGQHRYYRLEAGPLDAVRDWVAPYANPATVSTDTDTDTDADTGIDTAAPAASALEPAPPFGSAIPARAPALAGSLGRLAADIRHRIDATAKRLAEARR